MTAAARRRPIAVDAGDPARGPRGARPDAERHRRRGRDRRPGSPTGSRPLGLAVEVFHPDPAAIRDDPDWPGRGGAARRRCPWSSGGSGRPGGRRLVLSGHVDVVPPGDPATWTVDPWSGGGPRRPALRPRRLRHEGRRRRDPGRRAGAGRRRGARRASRASSSSRSSRPRRTAARARSRRSGPARPATWRDPGAVEPRRRHRPRGRHHVPAHRPGPGGPREPADGGRVGARQPADLVRRPRGGRGAAQRGRDASR